MIRLTLSDGTRIQLPASDIAAVEPGSAGTQIVKTSGESLIVLQDVRTVDARLAAAMANAARDGATLPAADAIDDVPDAATKLQTPVDERVRAPETPNHRRKRLLLGRVSRSAFMIGSTPFQPGGRHHRR